MNASLGAPGGPRGTARRRHECESACSRVNLNLHVAPADTLQNEAQSSYVFGKLGLKGNPLSSVHNAFQVSVRCLN